MSPWGEMPLLIYIVKILEELSKYHCVSSVAQKSNLKILNPGVLFGGGGNMLLNL